MLLAISGLAGTGKDSVADILAKGNMVKCALADPLKRIVRDIFDFTDEQLWGPSYKRNEPDKRYPRAHTFKQGIRAWIFNCACCGFEWTDQVAIKPPQCFLTPRYSLQLLGTEYGRHCYPDIWVNYAIRMHDRLQEGGCYYDQKSGMRYTTMLEGSDFVKAKKSIVIPDTRFKNELSLIQKRGGLVIRVKRPGVEAPAWQHASETEQMEIPDSNFDWVIENDGTLEDLEVKVEIATRSLANTAGPR
jgi:hypothetical protein